MEQVSVPLPLTREAILSLNNGSTTLEQARSLFNVDMKTFKARLLQESIFVWNEFRFGTIRIHGEDCHIFIFIKNMHRLYDVVSTYPFEVVVSKIERDLLLSPGCCKLTYKHPLLGNILLETDRDWHFAVEFSRATGAYMYLDLKKTPSGQTADEDAFGEDAEDTSDDDCEDALPGDANSMEQASVPVPFTNEAILSTKVPKQDLTEQVSFPSPFTKLADLSTKIPILFVGFINGVFRWSKFLSTEIPKQVMTADEDASDEESRPTKKCKKC